jgi:hypothetical protein
MINEIVKPETNRSWPLLSLLISLHPASPLDPLQDGAQEYDQERQTFIESVGIRFLRFTNDQVYGNLEGVLERIIQKIGELRDNPPSPPY